MGRREHDPGASADRVPFKEQVVHEVYLDELLAACPEASCSTTSRSPTLAQSFVDLRVLRLHNWRTLSRPGPGSSPGPSRASRSSRGPTRHGVVARALDVVGRAAPLWWGADDNPGGGFWQRQWLWSKPRRSRGRRPGAEDHHRLIASSASALGQEADRRTTPAAATFRGRRWEKYVSPVKIVGSTMSS
jgi:hypothetical protein